MPLATTLVLRKTLNLVKLFEGFSEQEVADFLRIARRADVAVGEVVIQQGQRGEDAYIVVADTAAVLLRFHRESLSLQPGILVKVLVNLGRLMATRLRQMNDKVLGASLSLPLRAGDAAGDALDG